ncbi:hypothetical protein NPIL_32441 [Nephila pilipes]|uniref:Uncharacterized protein n=1 Tax=Nephila pilipes TaxID=299642 RepID=A0A8X6Q0S1_NEPPI|nr:hypothetical protein NPIL_32441 [Nephila pilipes]
MPMSHPGEREPRKRTVKHGMLNRRRSGEGDDEKRGILRNEGKEKEKQEEVETRREMGELYLKRGNAEQDVNWSFRRIRHETYVLSRKQQNVMNQGDENGTRSCLEMQSGRRKDRKRRVENGKRRVENGKRHVENQRNRVENGKRRDQNRTGRDQNRTRRDQNGTEWFVDRKRQTEKSLEGSCSNDF